MRRGSLKINITKLHFCCALLLLTAAAGCQSPPATAPTPEREAKSVATPTPQENLTTEAILDAMKAAKLPVEKEVVYTAENDPNKLMGRPNQYTGKASWNDARVESLTPDDRSMTVEVFASSEDLENRRRYVEAIGKSMSPLAQYFYVHKNALLRLSHKLTPQQAAEYEKVFKSL
jgi:hypothetical protein